MIDYAAVTHRYSVLYPDEKTASLRDFLSVTPEPTNRVDRKNFRGHLTASCLLVDVINRRILLFYNSKYKLILQPGAHLANPAESAVEVATRKLFQETSYGADQARYLAFDYDPLVPIDIDSHHIPANPARGERAHVHHDLRYVFVTTTSEGAGREVTAREPNSGQELPYVYEWYDLEELSRWVTFSRLFSKLQRFLSRDSARRRFYVGLTTQFPVSTKVNTIVVTHILPDSFDFLEVLNRCTNLIGVIPKPKSVHEDTKRRLLSSGIKVLDFGRDKIGAEIPKLLKDHDGQKTVLLDIGGWFVPALDKLPDSLAKSIAGVVEDTKNGQDKYEAYATANALPFPVISVAESQLKANEDFLVGQSVVFSADTILRECGLILEYLECGVIGYGKIGKSIALHLKERGVTPNVVETNALRRLEAYRSRCSIRHRDWVSRNTDVVFCATGKRATDIIDLRSLRPGAFLFSVTSSDDEFDLSLLESEYTRTVISRHVSRYDSTHNYFYLVNNGNAVNFLHNAVLWEFIQLVKGGIFLAMRNLAEGGALERIYTSASRGPGFDSLFELSEDEEKTVAKLWMETILLGFKLEE
ncbi:MAG TPA: hypothetical protein VK582_17500 [Pyrinomonadaceae bacterium]|nr:hypothetical protein [Pyrinomonadaceae bacterium]